MTEQIEEVLSFWLEEVGPAGWYEADEALDGQIAERFGEVWRAARRGELKGWSATARGALALVIVLDQFPRNMFRGSPESFATDRAARILARRAIDHGFDKEIEGPARQFFYLPFMHSESLMHQERAIWGLLKSFGHGESLRHAQAHREIIRRFGRFPYRNEALSRQSSQAEREFLVSGGYAAALRELAA